MKNEKLKTKKGIGICLFSLAFLVCGWAAYGQTAVLNQWNVSGYSGIVAKTTDSVWAANSWKTSPAINLTQSGGSPQFGFLQLDIDSGTAGNAVVNGYLTVGSDSSCPVVVWNLSLNDTAWFFPKASPYTGVAQIGFAVDPPGPVDWMKIHVKNTGGGVYLNPDNCRYWKKH